MMMKHCFKWTTFRKFQSDIIYHCTGFFQYADLLENHTTEKVAVQSDSFSRYPSGAAPVPSCIQIDLHCIAFGLL